MRSRWQAALLALVFGAIPYLDFISKIIVGLVTLRWGAREGLWILIWGVLPSIVWLISGYSDLFTWQNSAGFVAVWLLAQVLSGTASWAKTLEAASILAIVVLISFYAVLANPAAWWLVTLNEPITHMAVQFSMHLAMGVDEISGYIAQLLTGAFVAYTLFTVLTYLMLARAAQAVLYNPGGFKQEIVQIRLSKRALGLMLITLLAGSFNMAVAANVSVVLFVVWIMAGVSVIHCLLSQLKTKAWLILFYVLFLFIPHMLLIVGFIAILDTLFDLRYRLQRGE